MAFNIYLAQQFNSSLNYINYGTPKAKLEEVPEPVYVDKLKGMNELVKKVREVHSAGLKVKGIKINAPSSAEESYILYGPNHKHYVACHRIKVRV